jgi:hypothetical protein
MLTDDLCHMVFEHQFVKLDLLFFDLVLLREEGFVAQLLEPPLVLLVLFVQAAELVIGADQLLLERLVPIRHFSLLYKSSEGPAGVGRPGG